MKSVAVQYVTGVGWVVEVPYAIHDRHLQELAKRALAIQEDRLLSLKGDERRWAELVIDELRKGKISQRVVGREGNSKGDIDLIPPVPTGNKVYSMPGFAPGGKLVRG